MAGFVNGLFLVFVAFFIFSEAVEVCYFSNRFPELYFTQSYCHY